MKKLLYLIIPAIIYGDSLQGLLDHANKNNSLIKVKELTHKAKLQEMKASKSANYATVDVGGFYQSLNDKTPMMAGDIYSGYAKVSYNIYDGGKKSSITNQKLNESKSNAFDIISFQKSLNLQIIQEFFNVKNIDASIFALEEEKNSLKAQLKRIHKFYEANLATKDDVDKLQSASDTNSYNIQSLKFQKLSVVSNLELKVGKNISSLDKAQFQKSLNIKLNLDDSIQSLIAKQNSINNFANSLNSAYLPNIQIEDTFSIYEYRRTDTTHPQGLDNQNKIMLSVNLRLYDGGTVQKNKQAVMIQKQALKSQIDYKIKEQKMLFDLSILRINTSKLKIKSASSALKFASSAYNTINEKYKAEIVDNVAYLDALSVKTNATALYKKSLNDLEIAYAMYYYYAGKNIGEYIK